ncbi:MAG: hypothetical protein Q9183_006800, partial [Haloplaca sp. 2 TL-2023]
MVYDVPRNFVGDTHWRQPQTLQDGDELELEKGVLIQVGEEVERTETDLTELLEKRKPKPAPNANDENIQHTTPKTQAAGTPQHGFDKSRPVQTSALRPKTLNTLLGTPRGRVGRAVVSTKSPADLRKERESNDSTGDRSPKRRRLEYPTGSPARATSATLDSLQPAPEPTGRTKPPVRAMTFAHGVGVNRSSIVHQKPPHSVSPRREYPPRGNGSERRIRHEDAASHEKSKSPLSNLEDARISSTKNPPSISRSTVSEIRQKPSAVLNGNNNIERHRMQARRPTERPVDPELRKGMTTIDPASDNAFSNNDARSQNLLRIATSKPRKKLMYRDLLPQKPPPCHALQPSSKDGEDASSIATHAQKLSNPGYRLDDFHEAQRDRLLSRLIKCRPLAKDVPAQEDNCEQDRRLNAEESIKDASERSNNNVPSNTDNDYPVNDSLFLTQSSDEQPAPRAQSPISKETESNLDIPAIKDSAPPPP